MSVHKFDAARPRRRRVSGDGAIREALADLAAFYYADDLTVINRAARHFAAYERAKELLTPQEMDAAFDRMHAPEVS